jgi:hypothetical protein
MLFGVPCQKSYTLVLMFQDCRKSLHLEESRIFQLAATKKPESFLFARCCCEVRAVEGRALDRLGVIGQEQRNKWGAGGAGRQKARAGRQCLQE